jgi:hypothetical protein
MDSTQIRNVMIAYLERALKLAEDLEDHTTEYLIERALDEVHGQLFSGLPPIEQLN